MDMMETAGPGVGLTLGQGIARIVIDNRAEDNLLNPDILQALFSVCERLRDDPAIHVVTIRGAGEEFFSKGIMTPSIKQRLGKEGVLELVRLANRTFDAIEALPQIVIAGINGFIRAGAVELVLACDIRIAGDHCRMSLPEAKWGGFPGAGAPVRLPLVVGRARAIELICSAREIDVAEMERIGLVEFVVAKTEVAQALEDMAASFAVNGPLALRGAKSIVRTRLEPGFTAARALSDKLRTAFEWTGDADEGIAAHLEARQPRFSGH
jgi:enoyl-CoA hydratase/carnithine racemase